jgi:hypothetical protein
MDMHTLIEELLEVVFCAFNAKGQQEKLVSRKLAVTVGGHEQGSGEISSIRSNYQATCGEDGIN